MFFCRLLFQKSGTKSRGVLHFVPLRRFYAVLFVPLFCRLREKCGTLWKTTWLHNVDNIRQKDIKKFYVIPFNLATIFTELYIILFLNWLRKKFDQFSKNLKNFLPKKLLLSSEKYGFGIRDLRFGMRYPGKTYSGSRIEGSKRHPIPDPNPQHCLDIHPQHIS